MEFNEKLQSLRKQKSWTQEELAEALFISRTAVSKWESGRGYPNIESLKAISKLFAVSIDDLLSGDELITLAENDKKETGQNIRNLVFGVLDCILILLIFLPLFGQQQEDKIIAVSLLSFTDTTNYIKLIFISVTVLSALFGITQLALQNWQNRVWIRYRETISLSLTTFLIMFAIASRHPYPGAFLLCILLLKGILLIKRQ